MDNWRDVVHLLLGFPLSLCEIDGVDAGVSTLNNLLLSTGLSPLSAIS